MRNAKMIGMGLISALAIAVGLVACETQVDGGGSAGNAGSGSGNGGSAGNGGSGGGGGAGTLQWYTSCGDPVCMEPDGGPNIPPGATLCTTEMAGAACTTAGASCWPANSTCGVQLVCAESDPKNNPGGCPISRVSHKKGIAYLSEAEVASIADEATTMRLSSWHYKAEGESAKKHVGFLIDDMPESIAVAESGERVDLYGYTSMAIAAVQVQDKRLRMLEQELASMRAEVTRLRAQADKCASTPPVQPE